MGAPPFLVPVHIEFGANDFGVEQCGIAIRQVVVQGARSQFLLGDPLENGLRAVGGSEVVCIEKVLQRRGVQLKKGVPVHVQEVFFVQPIVGGGRRRRVVSGIGRAPCLVVHKGIQCARP